MGIIPDSMGCRWLYFCESVRTASDKVGQRHVLYLGALTPAEEQSWTKTLRQFDPPRPAPPELPGLGVSNAQILSPAEDAAVRVRLDRLHRQWFENSAVADLLGEDYSLAAKETVRP